MTVVVTTGCYPVGALASRFDSSVLRQTTKSLSIVKEHRARPDILNVGGFSDAGFGVIAQFMKAEGQTPWAEVIDQAEL